MLSSPLVTKAIQKFWKNKQTVRKILEKGTYNSEKTSFKKLKTLPRNCTIKINLQNMKII